jgi:hypothetical protein
VRNYATNWQGSKDREKSCKNPTVFCKKSGNFIEKSKKSCKNARIYEKKSENF